MLSTNELILPFDLLPCKGSTLENINAELFKLTYLPQAIDDETLEENHREIKLQLSSLRFYSLKKDYLTHAGILLFGSNPLFFLPGAYVQFVRYEGADLASDVVDEQQFSGDLINSQKLLRENGNPEAEFEIDQPAYLLVKIKKRLL